MLAEFFQPIKGALLAEREAWHLSTLGQNMHLHTTESGFPDLDGVELVFFGVADDRGTVNNAGCAQAANAVRPHLYQLFTGDWSKIRIADLGDLAAGTTIDDTYFALVELLGGLLKQGIVPLVLGGGQDLTYAQYRAYEPLEQMVNMVAVDPRFDLGNMDEAIHSHSYLSKVLLQSPTILNNFSNIGYQTYFVHSEERFLLDKMHFDAHRLGNVRAKMSEVEPVVRNADMVSFDMGAIKQSDAPGNAWASPNGFTSDEACLISRYAGMSDKVSSFGVYEYNPTLDQSEQTAHLVAQMLWCFIDGFVNRMQDYPYSSHEKYVKYNVLIDEPACELIFYKSHLSGRWWIEVPYPEDLRKKYQRHALIPCSYNDYQTACQQEVPDRWWKAYQKID